MSCVDDKNFSMNIIDMRSVYREKLDLSIDECVWFILFELSKRKQIKKDDMYDILIHTYKFFKLFNNNYRPIYHLESYMLYLTRKIHGLPEGMSNP